VLAAAESFLFCSRDDVSVHNERGRRIMKDRIDTEHAHVTLRRFDDSTMASPSC
jgi:hypothetical protein